MLLTIGKAAAALFADRDNVLISRLDLLDGDSIETAVAIGRERFGTIDVLLNNAGYGAYGPLEATPMSAIRRQSDVNVFGLIETIQASCRRCGHRATGRRPHVDPRL